MNDLISVTSSFETLSEDIFSIKPKDLDKINGDLNEENHQLLSALQSNKESFQIELEHLTKEIDKLKSKYEESVQNLNNISGKSVEQEQENGELKSINEKLVQNLNNISGKLFEQEQENDKFKIEYKILSEQQTLDQFNLSETLNLLTNENKELKVQIQKRSLNENLKEILMSNEKKYQSDLTKMSEVFATGVMEFKKIELLKNKEKDVLLVQIDQLNIEIKKNKEYINFYTSEQATQNKNQFEKYEIKQMKSRSPHIPWLYGKYGNGPSYTPGETDEIKRNDMKKFKSFHETTNLNSHLEIMELILEDINEANMFDKRLLENVVKVLK
jgi:hypothetical protein